MSLEYFAGIEIGGSKLQIVVGDEKANILKRFRFPVNKSAGAGAIRQLIEETFKSIDQDSIRAVGIGFGGPVDHVSGKIFTSYHIDGWTDFNISQWLSGITGIFVSVENDANVAALGEALFGAGRNYENVFYITLGSGLGSGLVVNKKIFHGSRPGEMELGHIRLDKPGRTLESSCSGWAVDEKIRTAIRQYPKSVLTQVIGKEKGSEARFLRQAIDENDPVATGILDTTLDDLAFGLSHAVHLLHPQTIILGGGMSQIGEPLRVMLEQKIPGYLMDAFLPGPDIQLSRLGEDAVPVGALALAIQSQQII